MTADDRTPFDPTSLPASLEPAAARAAAYAGEVAELLFHVLIEVVREREPRLEPVLRGDETGLSGPLRTQALQVLGMWLHLLSIAEQNAAMRRRRQIETEKGPAVLRGTLLQAVRAAKEIGMPAEDLRALLSTLRVRPTITAHPTEAKRVTVLEKHRRIYRLLVELEAPRWTPRERQNIVQGIKNEIALLWMTGELRLEKPTVEQEVYWALHFFNETLFEQVPVLQERMERALAEHYPEHDFYIPPFLQFGCWVGGDRDGNPFVTPEITVAAARRASHAVLGRYRQALDALVERLSLSA
ncbi:MAG TPA: phosphoenolpyruvate carboxylase, partial [Gemmatimonadales bacterium]|nr:phosphoenolpyruvate carboxylase [Gemmatimonadales bacterium]